MPVVWPAEHLTSPAAGIGLKWHPWWNFSRRNRSHEQPVREPASADLSATAPALLRNLRPGAGVEAPAISALFRRIDTHSRTAAAERRELRDGGWGSRGCVCGELLQSHWFRAAIHCSTP